MKRLTATIILASTILLTGCMSTEKKEVLESAIICSKEFIAKQEFKKAKGILEYVSQSGGSNLDGYSNLSGQLDRLLLAIEYYENSKYDESTKILKELFNQENVETGIIKGVVSLGKKITDKTQSEEILIDNIENGEISTSNISESSIIDWDTIEASSSLAHKSKNYKVENVIDDNKYTSWIEGISGDGIGEYIKFSSENTFIIDKINIINGLSKSERIYKNNNRIKKVTIEFSDNSKQVHELEDNNMEYQTIYVGNVNTNSVKIIIEEVYTDGRVYQDTCISEVAIYGQPLQ